MRPTLARRPLLCAALFLLAAVVNVHGSTIVGDPNDALDGSTSTDALDSRDAVDVRDAPNALDYADWSDLADFADPRDAADPRDSTDRTTDEAQRSNALTELAISTGSSVISLGLPLSEYSAFEVCVPAATEAVTVVAVPERAALSRTRMSVGWFTGTARGEPQPNKFLDSVSLYTPILLRTRDTWVILQTEGRGDNMATHNYLARIMRTGEALACSCAQYDEHCIACSSGPFYLRRRLLATSSSDEVPAMCAACAAPYELTMVGDTTACVLGGPGAPPEGPSGEPPGGPSGEPPGVPPGVPPGTPSGTPPGTPSGTPPGGPSGTPPGGPSGVPPGVATPPPSGTPSNDDTITAVVSFTINLATFNEAAFLAALQAQFDAAPGTNNVNLVISSYTLATTLSLTGASAAKIASYESTMETTMGLSGPALNLTQSAASGHRRRLLQTALSLDASMSVPTLAGAQAAVATISGGAVATALIAANPGMTASLSAPSVAAVVTITVTTANGNGASLSAALTTFINSPAFVAALASVGVTGVTIISLQVQAGAPPPPPPRSSTAASGSAEDKKLLGLLALLAIPVGGAAAFAYLKFKKGAARDANNNGGASDVLVYHNVQPTPGMMGEATAGYAAGEASGAGGQKLA